MVFLTLTWYVDHYSKYVFTQYRVDNMRDKIIEILKS